MSFNMVLLTGIKSADGGRRSESATGKTILEAEILVRKDYADGKDEVLTVRLWDKAADRYMDLPKGSVVQLEGKVMGKTVPKKDGSGSFNTVGLLFTRCNAVDVVPF